MFKKIVEYIKKLKKPTSYLVICRSKEQAEYLFERMRNHCISSNLSYWNDDEDLILGVHDYRWIHIRFISVHADTYIEIQAVYPGKTLSCWSVDEWLDIHKEKPNADT